MDLNFSPAGMAVLGENVEQALVVLLGGIEVGVDEWAAIVVSPAVDYFGIFSRPPFQAVLLLGTRYRLLSIFGIDGRFEMNSRGKDQVHGAADRRVRRAPGRGRQDL